VKGKTDETITAFQAHIELITKLGTVTVVILYVLGLLVTNVHLMGLGIADFSALQARFVLIGVLFLCYCGLLFACPIAFFLAVRVSWQLSKNFSMVVRLAITLVLLSFWTWVILLIYGSLLSDLYPWGPSYESQWSGAVHLRETLKFAKLSLQMAQEAFFHTKIFVGLIAMCMFVAYFTTERRTSPGSQLAGRVFWLCPIPMFLVLFGYAQNVFPNLPYNLGGGQPRVVQLYMREPDSPFLNASGLAMEVLQGRPATSVPLALWHQDSSFLYVAPMSTQNSGAARLTAIPLGTVATMAYHGGYVKVTAFGRIQEAHVDPMGRKP
jgi:hypothetical protein